MSSGFFNTVDTRTIEAAGSGDRRAQEVLYRQFSAPVYGLARRMLAEVPAAEDATHEIFLDLFGKLGQYRGDAPFGAWLRRVAVNHCLMRIRSGWNSRRDALAAEPEGVHETAGETGKDLETLLDRLSPTDRAVLWLKEVEGFSHAEIATMFNRSVSFSKSRLARAHEQLRSVSREEVNRCMPQPIN